MLYAVHDWDDAYGNAANIPGGERWPEAWIEPARAFRDGALAGNGGRADLDIAYGRGERERLDLFLPKGTPRGLVAFVHGGYWMALDKSYWSHLAGGAVARDWAVAVPSYPLAPQARVGDITRAVASAVDHASGLVDGPVRLVGHSAGGHLVSRLVCEGSPFQAAGRVERVVSVSGLHDLRPLMRTALNDTLRLDAGEAAAESPALLRPRPNTTLIAWVGAGERAEFVRQSDLLANIWRGLGARTESVHEPDRHHFTVVDGLADPASPLVRTLLAE